MNSVEPFQTRLANASSGFAEVMRTDTGRRIGTVQRLDPHMVVSGTRWEAKRGLTVIGHGDTRAEAIAVLVAYVADQAAKAAAFINRNA